MLILFQIIVLIMSAIVHEYMHGWMADRLGDGTAKNAGRLTLNPIAHFDPIGSFFVPVTLVLLNAGFVFGWAKPVPYNPYNLSDKKYGSAKVAAAGPAGNLIIALFFGLIIRFFHQNIYILNPNLLELLYTIVLINIMLMIFNLVPIPPMDGSKILMTFLPYKLQLFYANLHHYGMFLVMFFVMFGYVLIVPIIWFVFKIITGIS